MWHHWELHRWWHDAGGGEQTETLYNICVFLCFFQGAAHPGFSFFINDGNTKRLFVHGGAMAWHQRRWHKWRHDASGGQRKETLYKTICLFVFHCGSIKGWFIHGDAMTWHQRIWRQWWHDASGGKQQELHHNTNGFSMFFMVGVQTDYLSMLCFDLCLWFVLIHCCNHNDWFILNCSLICRGGSFQSWVFDASGDMTPKVAKTTKQLITPIVLHGSSWWEPKRVICSWWLFSCFLFVVMFVFFWFLMVVVIACSCLFVHCIVCHGFFKVVLSKSYFQHEDTQGYGDAGGDCHDVAPVAMTPMETWRRCWSKHWKTFFKTYVFLCFPMAEFTQSHREARLLVYPTVFLSY